MRQLVADAKRQTTVNATNKARERQKKQRILDVKQQEDDTKRKKLEKQKLQKEARALAAAAEKLQAEEMEARRKRIAKQVS